MISKRNMRFPARWGSMVFHSGRKLFAHSFLLPVTPLCFMTAGNFSPGRFLDSARNDGSDVVPLYFIAALLPFDKLFHL